MGAHLGRQATPAWGRASLQAIAIAMALTGATGCGDRERAPQLNPQAACASDYVLDETVQQAAASVEAAHGSVALVMFYASSCPRTVGLLPEFLRISNHFGEQGLEAFAFSTDECKKEVEDLLVSYELTFAPIMLVPWPSGELAAAFSGVGIQFGDTFAQPLLAVISRDGQTVMQWEPATAYDADMIEAVVAEEVAK